MKKENTNKKETKNQFSQMEEEVLGFWEKSNTFEKSVNKEAPQGDYVFYDGPPFITGLPHYATLLPSIAKDVVPRYWTMKGYRVERVWGWDCHGLPAENKVEEQLELRNKKDIEKLGVEKFVDACRAYVSEGSEQWQWYINRIARWVDMKHAYRTMDLNFMESVIWAFKELYNKGMIYEGYRSSLHCPRCATPLSKFEITMDAGSYRDVTDETVVIKFHLKPGQRWADGKFETKDKVYLLAWTTTPWTLPGNLALAVGNNIKYSALRINGVKELLIMAADRAEEILKGNSVEVVHDNIKGEDLIGLEYEPIFDLKNKKIQENKNAYKVYAADFVSTEDGTGIVHIAPNFGEDDFNVGQKEKLPIIDIMDENGIYTDEAGEWSGQYFKKANKLALEKLGEKLFSKFEYTHSYPFCYRCGTPLIYKTQKAWYLSISEIKQKMLDENKDINWVPEYFKEGRFQYNIENAPDWCLSRSRYWGSPIPVWRCEKCQEIKVAGSIEEIEKLSGQKIKDLHKPDIDNIVFKCACGGAMKRVPEVFDCWFESGAMPFAQFHYPFDSHPLAQGRPLNKKEKTNFPFPADFIIEYTGQLRGWFYYLHVLGIGLFDSKAFKNVIVTGVLAGTDGRKMSKSYGNYPDPKGTLEKYGGDALRMYFMSSPIMTGGDMNFNERDLEEALRKNVILLWNVFKFYEMFASEYKVESYKVESENILDKWILLKLDELIKTVTENMEKYDLPQASRPITLFIDDFSTWYLRRSRDRFKNEDEKDKNAALNTTKFVLIQLTKVMAPFVPFIAEQIWQKVTGNNFQDENKSVHLEVWPKQLAIKNYELRIIEEMVMVRKIVELGLAKRDEAGIKVRQPLNQLTINNYELQIEYEGLIKDELNVKNLVCEKGEGELAVELDTEITDELKLEGIKRDLVRVINNLRKDQGLTINDSMTLYYQTDDEEIAKTIKVFKKDLLKDILASDILEKKNENSKEFKINDSVIGLSIES
jgi:isoleucyl-tRNA synthetase